MGKLARTAQQLAGVLALGSAMATSAAIDSHPVFRHLDVSEGLPDQHVESIIQDVHGYVWIGTRGGLLRHEGAQLRLLPRNPADPGALPDNNIMSLHAHSDGMVWAGVSGQGVVEIGPDLKPRRHLAPISAGGVLPHGNIWSMAEDCDGRLWMAFMREGVGRYDPVTEDLLLIAQDEAFGLSPAGFQTNLMVDSACRIWLVQTERLAVFDPAQESFREVLRRGPQRSEILFSAVEHEQYGVFTGRGGELLVLDPERTPAGPDSARLVATLDGLISGLSVLPDGRLLVICRGGLRFVDPATGTIERIDARPDLPFALPHNRLANAHLVDREGGIWLALSRSGLVYLPPEHAAFARMHSAPGVEPGFVQQITALSEGAETGWLWVGSEEGEQRVDLENGRVDDFHELFVHWSRPLAGRTTRGFLEWDDGVLVLETGSLSYLSVEPGQTRPLIRPENLPDAAMQFMLPAGSDALWVGTSTHGLLHYDLADDSIRQYGPGQAGALALPESLVVDMVGDVDRGFWLAGPRTLYYHHAPGFGFEVVADLGNERIVDLAEGEDDSLWVATDAGLSRWRRRAERLERERTFDLSEVTERASIRHVFPGHGDAVWIVLSNGIARLDPSSGQTRAYARSDGLARGEFPPRASIRLRDGRLALGGSQGLVIVDPEQLKDRDFAPPVHLGRLSAADLEITLVPGERAPVALNWRQNSVRFDFSALTYVAPERVRYRVRLDGWDDDWLVLGRQSQMYYSNLRPGRYRFEVQAAVIAELWSPSGDAMTIEVAPPPWAGPWALSAYALLLLTGTGAGWQGLRKARRRRTEWVEMEHKRKLAEGQRQLIERLNLNLEPMPLAHSIVGEMVRLTAAHSACFGYVHELMPLDLIAQAEAEPLSREAWLRRLKQADGFIERAIDLKADRELVARVLLLAPGHGFSEDHEQRLALLVDLVGQSLHNAVLLQRVKRLADRAEQANRAKSEFLATMSHEIRTPLHGVMGMADLLYETQTDASQQELLETLRASGRQLQCVIDDVLDISRIEAGCLDLHREPFELMPLLEQVIDLHAPNAARKCLDLRLRIEAALPLLGYGDPDRLSQVLGNLISNAVKFTDGGGVELAAAVAEAHTLVITVSDSGPGIAQSEREKLFQPFRQLDASISRTHGGSGLGLAICRRLTDAMGGSLELGSQRWNGSRFVLRLPAGPLQPPPCLTRMLAGLELVALLDAPTYRVLMRLARRWGFAVSNGWRLEPQRDALVLVDSRHRTESNQVRAWIEGCRTGIRLESPYRGQEETGLTRSPTDLRFLRWPLVESRLVGALLDLVMSRPD